MLELVLRFSDQDHFLNAKNLRNDFIDKTVKNTRAVPLDRELVSVSPLVCHIELNLTNLTSSLCPLFFTIFKRTICFLVISNEIL